MKLLLTLTAIGILTVVLLAAGTVIATAFAVFFLLWLVLWPLWVIVRLLLFPIVASVRVLAFLAGVLLACFAAIVLVPVLLLLPLLFLVWLAVRFSSRPSRASAQ